MRPSFLDAGPPVFRFTGDAGAATGCRLVYGPVQDLLTGPAALTLSPRGIEVVQHQNGVAIVHVFPTSLPPPPSAKAPERTPLAEGGLGKASKPPCAVAGRYAFCSDSQGNIHKSLREMASDDVIGKAIPGGHLSAVPLDGDRTLLAYLDKRHTDVGDQFEAWAKVDGDPPVRISEDGAGGTDVVLARRKTGDVVAWLVDARISMAPVHSRVLRYGVKLEVGPDVVVHVAGGSTRFLHGALATSDHGSVIGLLPASSEQGFGLISVELDGILTEDEPFSFSPYPNGLDGAPLAATQGGKSMLVARVRPSRAPGEHAPPSDADDDGGAVLPTNVLELGRVDEKGVFSPMGLVPSLGSVTTVAAALDSFGALWLHYTDGRGSWLERRVCPNGP